MAARRALTVLLLAGAIGVPVALAARSADTPKYLTGGDARLALNGSWRGTRLATGVSSNYLPSVAQDPAQFVWAPTCPAGKQTVEFSRTVELLGPATSGRFQWLYGSLQSGSTALLSWRPIQSFQFLINGEVAFSSTGTASSGNITAAGLKAIHPGSNNLLIKAVRAPLPKGVSACNARGKQPLLGLTAAFDFSFATDLRVGVPAENPAIRHATSVITTQFVKNEGPDTALNVRMMVFNGNSTGTLQLAPTGATCRQDSNSTWYCDAPELAPGSQFSVVAKLAFTPNPGIPNWDHQGMSLDFRAMSDTPDSKGDNDVQRMNIVFCQDGSTFTSCK